MWERSNIRKKQYRGVLNILPPSQNIIKNELKKLDVFGLKFEPNTFTFVDQFLLIFWDGGSIKERDRER
jgi:hypothetical protein